MTRISEDEVAHLADLGSISLNDKQKKRLAVELADILGYVEQLGELDTDGVTPTYQVTDLAHVTRADEVIDYGVKPDELLALAPEQADHQIKVPKVL